MGIYRHFPAPPLNQYVEFFWYYVDLFPGHDREHVLPDASSELIINLQDTPRNIFDPRTRASQQSFKRGWLSGAHSKYLIIDALPASSMIGVHFKPGGVAPFLGRPAAELGNQVVELEDLWGAGVWQWRDRLLAATTATAKFQILERLLLQRLDAMVAEGVHRQAVMWAVSQYLAQPHARTVASVSRQLGFSQKHFIHLFRQETGLTPKLFCRVRRFHSVLAQIQTRQEVDWADVACACGYYDQSHFANDFVAFSGFNPTRYLRHRLKGELNFTVAD